MVIQNTNNFITVRKTYIIILLSVLSACTACKKRVIVKEEDKIFHAGPVNSGFGGIFFGLYKDNKYQFCDGDFMDPGCYTGYYGLSGDTIMLFELKKHTGIPANKFVIRRYKEMDSSYWQWKYADHKNDWENMRDGDLINSATGDIFPLNQRDEIVFDRNNYFLIRFDQLTSNRIANPARKAQHKSY